MLKKIVLIGNPVAGGGAEDKIKKAAELIRGRGFNVRLMLTRKKGDAESFAKEISQESDTPLNKGGQRGVLVIAAGGDGTYNEVANGLVYSGIPMAILSLGTTSVLAKEINMPEDIQSAVDIALNGRVETIHLGKITYTELRIRSSELKDNTQLKTQNPKFLTRYFLLMAGIGFDGQVVFGVNENIKRHTGKGAYILSGLKTFLTYNPNLLTIEGDSFSAHSYTAIISKASYYGGKFRITPDARLTDPWFYVFFTHKKSRLALLRYVAGVLGGHHLSFKDTGCIKINTISVEGSAHIQIDGDYLGTTPAKIELAKDALKLVFPK